MQHIVDYIDNCISSRTSQQLTTDIIFICVKDYYTLATYYNYAPGDECTYITPGGVITKIRPSMYLSSGVVGCKDTSVYDKIKRLKNV